MSDVIDDLVGRIRNIVGNNADIVAVIEREEKKVRHDRGGSMQYVAKNTSIEVRRERATECLRRGAPVRDTIKSSGLGRNEVYKLLKVLKT